MAQWLSAFAVLAEDTGLALVPTWWHKIAHKFSSKRSMSSLASRGIRYVGS